MTGGRLALAALVLRTIKLGCAGTWSQSYILYIWHVLFWWKFVFENVIVDLNWSEHFWMPLCFIHKCMAFSNVRNLVEATSAANPNKNNQIWYAYIIPFVNVRLGSSVSLSMISASGAWCLYVLNLERESWRDMEQLRTMIDIFNMLYTVKCYLWQLQ